MAWTPYGSLTDNWTPYGALADNWDTVEPTPPITGEAIMGDDDEIIIGDDGEIIIED